MKNRWIKILCVLLMALMCVSLSACQTSEKKADDSATVDENEDMVEEDETDVDATIDAEDADDAEADVIEESTMDFDEFIGDEEAEQNGTVTETIPEMEDEEAESIESTE